MGFIGNILGGITKDIFGGIDGQNQAQNSANSATAAANQASGAENQLIQSGLLPIYNSMLNNYNTNYAPYQSGAGASLNDAANAGGGVGQTASNAINAYQNADSATGINQTGLTNQNLNYLSNPNKTNLAQTYGAAQDTIGNSLNAYSNFGQQGQSILGNSAAQLGNTDASISSQLNPNNSATSQVGGKSTLPFYLQEQSQGLSDASRGAAESNYASGVGQSINSARNSLGSGVPNETGFLSNLGENAITGQAGLAANLAGQNQQYQNLGAQGAFSTAQGIDQNSQRELGMQADLANTTNTANRDAVSTGNTIASGVNEAANTASENILKNSGALDYQTAGMLNNAQQSGNAAQQQKLNNIDQAYGISNDQIKNLLGYLQGGQSTLENAAQGESGLVDLYGNSAAGLATQANNDQNQANGAFGNLLSTATSVYGASQGVPTGGGGNKQQPQAGNGYGYGYSGLGADTVGGNSAPL